jgi:hypothetical protein
VLLRPPEDALLELGERNAPVNKTSVEKDETDPEPLATLGCLSCVGKSGNGPLLFALSDYQDCWR